ncbi:MAG TPA: hypothetical protein VFI74_05395 [Candidatus Saccharimonadales bacterium]|nr:hypothetical protein [Candidatus Saccharimonadales bacterium]
MNPEIELNERVEVAVLYRAKGNTSQICMPAKMRYKGQEIIFTELGLRHPTSKGHRMIHVFDMSDGCSDYRLEFDAERLTWTLTKILEVQS